MKTIYEIKPVWHTNFFETVMASSLEKAEQYLRENGFENVTVSSEDGHQTWFKKNKGTFFVKGETITVVVLPFNRFID